jgi:phosphatidate cytidylyltransferase
MGVAYVIGLGLHVYWLRELPNGSALLVTTLLGIWAADTFAFFVGIGLGRTPLAPEISPHKSVEGLVGGVVGAGAVVTVAAMWLAPELGTGRGIVVGAVIGLVAPAGDLLESMIKRNLGLKDTSRLIPGHGGVLDRVDSLLIAAPVAYYLFWFLLR